MQGSSSPYPCSPPDLCCLMKPNGKGCHKPCHTIRGRLGCLRAEPRQARFVFPSSGTLILQMKEAESRRSRQAALLRTGKKCQTCSPAPPWGSPQWHALLCLTLVMCGCHWPLWCECTSCWPLHAGSAGKHPPPRTILFLDRLRRWGVT